MARRKIREFDAKRIIAQNILGTRGDQIQYLQYRTINQLFNSILIGPKTSLESLPTQYPWLLHQKLVVKPDMLFGQRKKLGLVLLGASWHEAVAWLNEHRNKEFSISKATGSKATGNGIGKVTDRIVTDKLTHFLIELYVPHEKEYYLAITSERDGDTIHFSEQGGIDIEENWDKVHHIVIPTLQEEVNFSGVSFGGYNSGHSIPTPLLSSIPQSLQPFIQAVFQLYRNLDFTYLEFNPFTIDHHGHVVLLDTVAEVDDCAQFKNVKQWGDHDSPLPFPKPFGRTSFPEEEFIAKLDEESGASLKLTVLNPQGKIWNILSGGGASIIYLDAITNAGKGMGIANYGEYSGNPTTEESYQYAKTVLDLMTRRPPIASMTAAPPDPGGKILFVGGAIANFTDVEKTFTGIVRALEEYADKLRQNQVSIYVRRGGPNWEKGLKLMKETGEKLGLAMEVQGPEKRMTEMVGKVLGKIEN